MYHSHIELALFRSSQTLIMDMHSTLDWPHLEMPKIENPRNTIANLKTPIIRMFLHGRYWIAVAATPKS